MIRSILLAAALAVSASSAAMAETVPVKGEVTKINEAQSKITLRHDPIPNLDMDSMTMVFTAGEPEMLTAVSVGDKVVFEADRVKGKLTIVKIEPAK